MYAGRLIKGPGREIDPSVFNKHGTVLLESIRKDKENSYSYLFQDPAAVIQCTSSQMVESSIEQIEKNTREGMYAAGFMGYEAGTAWTPKCPEIISNGFPLLWFGLYEKVERFETPLLLPASDHNHEPIEHSLDVSREEYQGCVRKVLQLIRDGETYQVNYTARTRFRWNHDAWQLYLRLRRSQPVPYGAFLNCGQVNIVSLSPELFLMKCGNILHTRPMKGTAPRGTDRDSDGQIMKWLGSDPKNMAENRMIVDLMRNDLGRLSEIGKVQVTEPFRVEPYSSLLQMTSGVKCTMREGISLSGLLKATFPPGSITGAPKINTMGIISKLEKAPRKVYTGAIGFIDPGGDLAMNVAIRTIICTTSGTCEMGVGSGIVSDSVPEDEFRETALKADFLNITPCDRVDLFETILLQDTGALLWFEEHLDRMEKSAVQLSYPFLRAKAREVMSDQLGIRSRGPAIVRLILTRTGEFSVEVLPFASIHEGPRRVLLSRYTTDPGNELLHHKTTFRDQYDLELAQARKLGYVEALFTNINGHLTEGAFTNLFVYGISAGRGSGWRTPEVQCGLLPGIWRQKFMESSRAVSTTMGVGELSTAERVVIGNSVRGAMEVDEVVDADGHTVFKRHGCHKGDGV
jgi:para-aminobenzoate synthetase/4-amino-4-deoxychorismate lyase